jgi:16S rRNA (cytosine967-C5)-methyltransferase
MSARDFALAALDATALPNWRQNLIHKQVLTPTDPRDLALAEQIRVGVIKNLLLLQHLMVHHSGRKLKEIDPLAQKIMAMALYQLRFLTRVPASAAVNEAVEQTARFGRGRAKGFVNAVLRKATREPDPEINDPSIRLSHPHELFDRLVALLGREDAVRFAEHDNREPPTLMRLLGDSRSEDLQAEGVTITPHEQPRMFVVEHAKQATLAEWSRRGIAQVQDATAAHVVEECEVRAGQSTLDRCCGFGTKTLQLAEKVGPSGAVLAVDPNLERTEGLRRVATWRARLLPSWSSMNDEDGSAGASPSNRADVITVATAGWMKGVDAATKTFDRVLVDVPCSNSGVLARRPEARYRQDEQTLRSLEKLQQDILLDTAAHVAPSGLLIYSTCSVWPEENEHICQWFLKQHPQFKLLRQHATLPSFDADPVRYHDGGYFAVFART